MKKAIALKYPEGAVAPIITAKGEGYIAEKILEEAEKNNVPVEENIQVINLLEDVKEGSMIPENAWELVAIIFSFIMEQNKQ